jgi:hypothetical protein
MGLVDYSDSDSETEVQPKAPAKTTATKPTANKPFQKFVDRSNPGKILVNLPSTASPDAAEPAQPSGEPPAKRARTTGGSRFSGFSSFLPPPKKTTAAPVQSSSGGKAVPRPGVHLKTGAEPAFSRELLDEDYTEDGLTVDTPKGSGGGVGGGGLKLPPPKNHTTSTGAGPSIPDGQKPAEEVKLVGKPLMFKPLSVSRKPVKKKTFKPSDSSGSTASAHKPPNDSARPAPAPAAVPEPPKKKISLFSIGSESESPAAIAEQGPSTGAYEPLFSSSAEDATGAAPEPVTYDDYSAIPSSSSYTQTSYHPLSQPTPAAPSDPSSLSSIANDLNLTAQARRELFGRDGRHGDSARVVNFDMSREYEHNEVIRQSGEAATHNPVRSIKAGKHSLRQLVNAVQSNASALEESFAAQKGKKNEAGARYGWR